MCYQLIKKREKWWFAYFNLFQYLRFIICTDRTYRKSLFKSNLKWRQQKKKKNLIKNRWSSISRKKKIYFWQYFWIYMSSLFIDKFLYSNTLEIKLFCEFQKTLLIKFLIPEKTFINTLHLRYYTLNKKHMYKM